MAGMTEEERQRLIEIEMSMRHHRSTEQIDEAVYGKALVALAYEYAKKGSMEEATSRLRWCGQNYREFIMPKQMREDPAFRIVAYHLAKLLVEVGIVDLTPKMPFAHKVGEA